MLCRNPFISAGVPYPCGQCMPCRFNRRKMWTHRLLLEGFCHVEKAFVTLTYDDDHLIYDRLCKKPILWKKDVQDFLKRLRFAIYPQKVRFYAVGEYGDNTERPHYHIILFGYPSCAYGNTRQNISGMACCPACDALANIWGKGRVFVGMLSKNSASYVASYTVKKMTSVDDVRLKGRTPEFCTMSLRPGIGADAMWDIASDLMRSRVDEMLVDVPLALKYGGKLMPLGRYLRRRLRKMIGRSEDVPEEVLQAYAQEMLPVRQAAFDASLSFKKVVVALGDGEVANIEARNSIYKGRKKL